MEEGDQATVRTGPRSAVDGPEPRSDQAVELDAHVLDAEGHVMEVRAPCCQESRYRAAPVVGFEQFHGADEAYVDAVFREGPARRGALARQGFEQRCGCLDRADGDADMVHRVVQRAR